MEQEIRIIKQREKERHESKRNEFIGTVEFNLSGLNFLPPDSEIRTESLSTFLYYICVSSDVASNVYMTHQLINYLIKC